MISIKYKCDKCACKDVCKHIEDYNDNIEIISKKQIYYNNLPFDIKSCPHIKVDISCPYIIEKTTIRLDNNGIELKRGDNYFELTKDEVLTKE